MKKFLTLVVALSMVIPMMAIGRNDGSTKANAIDFDWEAPMTHDGGTLWYVVNLDPLYEEETPALNLFLANRDAFNDTHTSLRATVAGQTDEKTFTIHPKQQRVWSANATMLVRLKQKEIYLTLTSDGPVMMSARVFEAADLDETCTDALIYNWSTGITKPAGVPVWYKLNIKEAKANTAQDVCVVVTNNGSSKLTMYANQSLDCPSSGVTRRTIELEAGKTLRDTVPNNMLRNVAFDEMYVSIENDQPVTIKVEYADRPLDPVLPAAVPGLYVDKHVPDTALHKSDTAKLLANQTYYFRYNVAELNSLKKYEPEFTFRNIGTEKVSIERKMSFEVPAYTAQGNTLEIEGGEESIEVIAKNTLLGLDATYIYVKIVPNKDIELISRFKHIREGKACKTNIDFNWDGGHRQDATTTQWYAVDLTVAKETLQDVVVYINNTSDAKASVAAALAFSCPYIDLQEISRPIAAGDTLTHRMAYSTYAMMTDTVWVSINTNQDIKFWAEMVPTTKKAVVDTICMNAIDFNWDEGAKQFAGDTVWYRVDMKEVREKAAKFPTVFVQNLSSTDATTITAELSLECPDSIENQKRSVTIAANSSYTKQLSRNMFENIKKDTIYLRVITTQDISLQIRLTEEAEGASCSSAIPFNWVSGNTQPADANLWYIVDLHKVMKDGNDIRIHLENKENKQCKGLAQLLYECPTNETPSVQNFKLSGLGEQAITLQNSAFEMVEDSAVYVNLQGNTSLRVWAEILPLKPFDTIYAEGLTITPLQWDTLYTQTTDTAWYIVPLSEIEKVRKLDEKVKPVVHAINLTSSAMTIKGEAAFAFPIGKKMMTKSQELKGNKHFTDTIPAGTFDQFLKKDSIILRVTRPKGAGAFQFRAELVKAFSGNSRTDALPVRLGERYSQEAMTSMWYKVNTVDWKKDKTLFNKCLAVSTKNQGAADATVKVAVYEGLMSEIDLLEEYGLNDYRERTVKKGENRNRNIPAQAVYAVGDVELYIQVTTTEPLMFETRFAADYKSITPDPKQQEAKLLVPNVDYVVPGDNQDHWYMVCVPYINAHDSKDGKIKRNYKYVDASSLSYELNGAATIEVTATFQDTMNCAMPVRKRTINKSGGYHKGSKPLRELIEKGLEKAGHSFDFTGTAPEFMDSLLHRFITQDSITGYIRIKTDNELKVRLNTPQITGNACDNAMMFDWEHGNVNAADSTTWYQVVLIKPDSTLIIPDSTDVRIYVENWGDKDNEVAADLYFDCNASSLVHRTRTIPAGGLDSIDIDRDRLEVLKSNMLINFSSTEAAHIWAALIDTVPRDTLCDTIRAFVCYGGSFEDTIRYNQKTIDPVVKDTMWTDTVTFADGVVMKDSLTTFILRPILNPEIITVDSMKKLKAAPLLVQGMQLFVDSSNVALDKYYKALGATYDTIIKIDTVYWAKPRYKSGGDFDPRHWDDLDLTHWYAKDETTATLALVIEGGCEAKYATEVVFDVQPYKYGERKDTLCPQYMPSKETDTLSYATPVMYDTLGTKLPRYIDTIVISTALVKPDAKLYTPTVLPIVTPGSPIDTATLHTISFIREHFDDNKTDMTMEVTDIWWQVETSTGWLDMPYTLPADADTATMRYIINTACDVKDTSNVIGFGPFTPPTPVCGNDTVWMTTPIEECDFYQWDVNGVIYTSDTHIYYNDGPRSGCTGGDQYYELNLIIKQHAEGTDKLEGCDSVVFKGKTYKSNTVVKDTIPGGAANQCDSIVTVSIIINHPATGTDKIEGCDSVVFKGKTYKSDVIVKDTISGGAANHCDSIVTVSIIINHPATGTDEIEGCDAVVFKGKTYTTSTVVMDTISGGAANQCDSIVTVTITVNPSYTVDTTAVECGSFAWRGTTYTESGLYYDSLKTVAGCDSVITLHLTVNPEYTMPKETVTSCNLYEWRGVTYTESGIYYDSLTTVAGCDSVYVLDLTINGKAYVDSLEIKAYYGYRIVMINRNQINALGWALDSLDVEHPEYVTWHEIDLNGNDKVVGDGGYYYNLPTGEPLPTGYQYYAVIDVPASAGAVCGVQGKTKTITVAAAAAAPALVPSLAKPGQDIQVINLDPEVETTIRLYTAEGLLQKTYKSYGHSTFTIKAAGDMGFYLVELNADNMKSTLRYIVK